MAMISTAHKDGRDGRDGVSLQRQKSGRWEFPVSSRNGWVCGLTAIQTPQRVMYERFPRV